VIGGSPVPQAIYSSDPHTLAASQRHQTVPRGQGYGNQLASAPAKPVVRMQMEEPTALSRPARSASLSMPSPAEMGLGGRSQPKDVNWVELRRQLDRFNATGFSLEKISVGYRVSFNLSTSNGSKAIRAEAADEAGALQKALTQAEKITGQ